MRIGSASFQPSEIFSAELPIFPSLLMYYCRPTSSIHQLSLFHPLSASWLANQCPAVNIINEYLVAIIIQFPSL